MIVKLLLNTQNKKYNPNKRQKILIIFDDMIADMLGGT